MTLTATTEQDARRRRTVVWVVALATFGLIFDGYDLVVYGVVVPIFLKDPSQLGEVTPAVAGTLGSYALLGMLFVPCSPEASVTSSVAAGSCSPPTRGSPSACSSPR
jgi:hypothetical protein